MLLLDLNWKCLADGLESFRNTEIDNLIPKLFPDTASAIFVTGVKYTWVSSSQGVDLAPGMWEKLGPFHKGSGR